MLNVGDSRAYWFEQGRKYVTTDHTLAQLEVKAGHYDEGTGKERSKEGIS